MAYGAPNFLNFFSHLRSFFYSFFFFVKGTPPSSHQCNQSSLGSRQESLGARWGGLGGGGEEEGGAITWPLNEPMALGEARHVRSHFFFSFLHFFWPFDADSTFAPVRSDEFQRPIFFLIIDFFFVIFCIGRRFDRLYARDVTRCDRSTWCPRSIT